MTLRFKDNIKYVGTTYENIVKEFKKKYFVFYFNSWEHDLYNNPMESLIGELLMKIASEIDLETKETTIKNDVKDRLKEVGSKVLSRVIKKITADIIEIEDFTEPKKDNTPKITSIRSQKEAVNNLLQELSNITGKRILIIVDELDRCKPSYAVELLEVVKHFFTHDDVVFLFGTNKSELEHTIRSLYGQGFNGYKYLNRFFDFEFSLPSIDNMY
ncbi:KAP family P-loop NTPase fold protein [Lactococcus paracarnosus]|nr:P-loop NTPase fold protein [Lactococcus paracarnosus]